MNWNCERHGNPSHDDNVFLAAKNAAHRRRMRNFTRKKRNIRQRFKIDKRRPVLRLSDRGSRGIISTALRRLEGLVPHLPLPLPPRHPTPNSRRPGILRNRSSSLQQVDGLIPPADRLIAELTAPLEARFKHCLPDLDFIALVETLRDDQLLQLTDIRNVRQFGNLHWFQ